MDIVVFSFLASVAYTAAGNLMIYNMWYGMREDKVIGKGKGVEENRLQFF